MVTRRDWLKYTAAAGASLALQPRLLRAQGAGPLLTRTIPSSGEELPAVGLGSSLAFRSAASTEELSAVREVLRTLIENGGKVVDTAPAYGVSEEVSGRIAQELGIHEELFWATKVNVAGRRGGSADPAAARAQIETSFRYIGRSQIDLIQVHNLGDVPTQLGILKELKEQGRVRYIGVTTTDDRRYPELARVMREEPVDFIGVDYAVDSRIAAERILPLAQDRGIAVLNYAPFGRRRLWARVRGREVPAWAREFDATTWAQFFIKYVVANRAVTVVTPATSKPANMLDDLDGGRGRLPDAAMRRRMEEVVDALPSA
jgi:aryl-alcohol dehydrogenase-like predicted oxidoreductase